MGDSTALLWLNEACVRLSKDNMNQRITSIRFSKQFYAELGYAAPFSIIRSAHLMLDHGSIKITELRNHHSKETVLFYILGNPLPINKMVYDNFTADREAVVKNNEPEYPGFMNELGGI
jgi:hypothetical protein